MTTAASTPPWYRQFWPWFLIALPGAVVIASFITLYIAIKNPDPPVQGDYERHGLTVLHKGEAEPREHTRTQEARDTQPQR